MFYGAAPGVFRNAFVLRFNLTKIEKILWQQLKNNRLKGYRFKCQHPIGGYIADFYCHKAKLVIEIDGEYHDRESQRQLDLGRQQSFEDLGLIVLRFRDDDVIRNLDAVVKAILSRL